MGIIVTFNCINLVTSWLLSLFHSFVYMNREEGSWWSSSEV